MKPERETNHKRLLISGNEQGCQRGGGEGWGGWVMITGECMCYCECCELYKAGESQTCIPETNNTLYVNLKKKKRNNVSE